MLREAPPPDRHSRPPRPVIFLDIDGVLSRGGGESDRRVDHDLLARFERLVEATNAKVVLASTWRHTPDGLADARRLVGFDDVLPDLRPASRAKEVQDWLARHPGTGRFVILDDEDDGYDELPLFQPQPEQGLTPEMASAAEAFLKGESDKDLRRNACVRMWQAVRFAISGHKG